MAPVVALAIAVLVPAGASAQESYPAKPVRIIVATAAGAANDMQARAIAPALAERLGRPVVVENRTGAGTIIGSEAVAKAPPDGYTLLMTVSALTINPASYKTLPYDVLRDFSPITQTVFVPNVLIVHPSLPVRSVKEFIAFAKARPGEILYASAGHGTNPHLTIELFASMAGIRLTHVPYKGGTPGDIALLGGEVAIKAGSVPSNIAHVRAGRLRALGVSSARRVSAVPDIPTIAEAGLPGYESVQWHGLLAPAKTPRDVIDRLHRETLAVLSLKNTQERFAADGSEIVGSSPEVFGRFLKVELAKWAKVVKAAGIKPE